MSLQRSSTDPVVAPAQVWDGLTAEAQAGAIRLMANLASNLVAQHQESTQHGVRPMPPRLAPPRSAPSISIAKP